MLKPKNKALLKKLANPLKPQLTLGKGEADSKVMEAIDHSLTAHELIKIRILPNSNDSLEAIAIAIGKATNAELVDIIGRVLIFYRPNPKNPRIVL